MALIVIEGLDRTGKSTVAKFFEQEHGYTVVHLSAPSKDTSKDQYMQEMVDLVSSAATQNIVLDRSHYGELVWPEVYSRQPLLSEEDIEIIREIEASVGVRRILMHDTNPESHWKRCVDNNEPLNKVQFVKARSLYAKLANTYGFETYTLPQFISKFPEAAKYSDQSPSKNDVDGASSSANLRQSQLQLKQLKTPEQMKLEKANAINKILSKRIINMKGAIYEDIEREIRDFLNDMLSKLLGGVSSSRNINELSFTPEEIAFYKAMYKKAIQKGE